MLRTEMKNEFPQSKMTFSVIESQVGIYVELRLF